MIFIDQRISLKEQQEFLIDLAQIYISATKKVHEYIKHEKHLDTILFNHFCAQWEHLKILGAPITLHFISTANGFIFN